MDHRVANIAQVRSISVLCDCGCEFSVKPDVIGQGVKCSACGETITPSLGLSESSREAAKLWDRLPPKRIKRSELPGIDILAEEVGRSPEGRPRHALFLGAGSSVSSGIDTASSLIEKWRDSFFRDRCNPTWAQSSPEYLNAYRQWLYDPGRHFSQYQQDARMWQQSHGRQPSEYAFLFSFVAKQPSARQELIEKLVQDKEPGPGYIYLASLVKELRFRTILTTNFDDLIHDALFLYAGIKPSVCAFDSQIVSIHPQASRPIIIKLHGDFMYNNIRNVGPEVQRLSQNMKEKLTSTCAANGLIVLGYSGGDESIMGPLSTVLQEDSHLKDGLHWCVLGDPSKGNEELTIPGEVWRLYENHRDRVQLYWTSGFDSAMEEMFFACKCKAPERLSKPRLHSLVRKLILGLENADWRWKTTSRFNELIDQWQQADQDERPWYYQKLDVAETDFTYAKNLHKHKQYVDEEVRIIKVIKICDLVVSEISPGQEPVPPEGMVRAYRRRSGALGQLFDIRLLKSGLEYNTTENLENFTELTEVAKFALQSVADAKAGLAASAGRDDCKNQLRALTYNVLAGYGNVRLVRGERLSAEEMVDVEVHQATLRFLDADGSDQHELEEGCFGYWLILRDQGADRKTNTRF